MKTNEGGSMASMILFGVGMVLFIAPMVLYLVKDETASKQWAEQTKAIVAENEKLRTEWSDAIKVMKSSCEDQQSVMTVLQSFSAEIDKIKYAQQLPAKPLTLPSTINFTVVERRKIQRVDDRGTLKPLVIDKNSMNGAHKPSPTEKKVIKKIKKQLKTLSQ